MHPLMAGAADLRLIGKGRLVLHLSCSRSLLSSRRFATARVSTGREHMKPAQQHGTPNTSISKVQTTSPAIGPSTPSAAPHTASRLPPFSLACLMPLIPQPNAANPMGIPKTAHPNWGRTMLVRAAPAPRRKAAFASPLSDVRWSSGRFVLSPDSVRRRRT